MIGSAFYLSALESDDPEAVRERVDRVNYTSQEVIERLEDGR